MTHHFTKGTIFKVFALLLTLLSGAAQGQQQGTAQTQTAPSAPPASPDAEMAALTNKVESLKIQKQVDSLVTQQTALEKQQRSNPAPTTTDEQMAAVQNQMKILQITKQVQELKAKQAALLNPPPPVVLAVPAAAAQPAQGTTARPLSPQDAEIQRLEEERQVLLKEQEIARIKKQIADSNAPPAPAPVNCVPKPGPKVTVKPPPTMSSWACKHLGVCADNTPTPVPLSNTCPAGTAPAAGTVQK